MRVAILAVDAYEVAFDVVGHWTAPSPLLHPAIQPLLDTLARCDDHEFFVVYGSHTLSEVATRRDGSLTYVGVPAPRRKLAGKSSPYFDRFCALRRYLRELKPDLVHAQGTERESAMVAVHSGLPNVVTLHGNFRELKKIHHPKPGSYLWLNAHLETHALKRTDAIFCLSRYVREITQSFGKPQFLIPNPVRPAFLAAARPPRASGPARVCCMGTLDERKRPLFMLRACIPLWELGLDFTFHVYGPDKGAYFEMMRREAEPWVQLGRVRFEGFTSEPLEAILQSDVMVSASVEESFGMNVLEAMAAGTPVVGSRIGGIQDIVEAEVSGLLYDVQSQEQCTAQIRRLLEDPALWHRLSQAGRERAAKLFSPERVAEQTLQAYETVLRGGA